MKLYHDSQPRFLIGTDKAAADGDWEISGPAPPNGDKVYAEVAPKRLAGGRGHRHKCKGGRSPKRTFPTGV
ncbi:MAG: hypothetical protein ACXWFH_04975 [Solirubrobacterales bacterium]